MWRVVSAATVESVYMVASSGASAGITVKSEYGYGWWWIGRIGCSGTRAAVPLLCKCVLCMGSTACVCSLVVAGLGG